MQNDTDWEACFNYFFRCRLITGEDSKPPEYLMRRRRNGAWEYRRPTREEERDEISRDSW